MKVPICPYIFIPASSSSLDSFCVKTEKQHNVFCNSFDMSKFRSWRMFLKVKLKALPPAQLSLHHNSHVQSLSQQSVSPPNPPPSLMDKMLPRLGSPLSSDSELKSLRFQAGNHSLKLSSWLFHISCSVSVSFLWDETASDRNIWLLWSCL